MKTKISGAVICIIVLWLSPLKLNGQNPDSIWTLERCIQFALQKNIQVQKAGLTNDINKVNADQSDFNRLPSVNATVNQNFPWKKQFTNGTYGDFSGSNNSSYSVNANVTLFNGFRISNSIRQSKLTYEAGKYDAETMKETVSLNVLSAYLQVLFAEEQVKNTQKQVESTEQQANLAQERLTLGSISKSDYLQVKSQLASEKQTLASSQSTLAIDRVTLMQLLEIPVYDGFAIYHPNFDNTINQSRVSRVDSVYNIALGIKPQIKSAQLNKENAEINVDIAKSSYMPVLSLGAGLSTGYNNLYDGNYSFQFKNNINPFVGLTLAIPIYQNNKVKAAVDIAKINITNAELDELNLKNQLRKAIEQASVDVSSAEKQYEADREGYDAATESYNVAKEKFDQGLINFVDFLIQKTNMITSESQFLQSKYRLIFSYKTLDFYLGNPLTI